MGMNTHTPSKASKNYHLYTTGSGYYFLFFLLYIPSFVGFWSLGIIYDDLSETAIKILGFIMIIASYPIAAFVASKFTHQPLRIQFDNEQITVDTFSRDLKTLKKSVSCQLKDLEKYQGSLMGHDKFQLTLSEGDKFCITPSSCYKRGDFKDLMTDFKAHVKTLNPDGQREGISNDRDWFTGLTGRVCFFLSVGGIIGGFSLLIIAWMKPGDFDYSFLKFPVTMIIFSLLYLFQYQDDGDGNDD